MMQTQYTKKIDMNGELMTVAEFRESVYLGYFLDYAGFGHSCKNGMMNDNIKIYSSEMDYIPGDATHIIWYYEKRDVI